MIFEKRNWICWFCHEEQEGQLPSLPICNKCVEAWKELILQKRKELEHD